jgi:hypothetical protein
MSEDATLDFLETRERFLPIQASAILERAVEDTRLSGEERDRFRTLFKMVQARFHFEFLDQVEQLKVLYDAFDPDRDTVPLRDLSPQAREAQFHELKERFQALLIEGNYVQLSREQLVACLELPSVLGLAVRVNLDEYKDLEVFYRGLGEDERRARLGFLPWQKRVRKVQVFKRVALLVRTVEKGEDVVYLKLFKNVVLEDVKMIAPRVRIRMQVFDKLKVGSTVVGGLAAPLLKLVMAAAFNTMLFIVVLGGCIGAFMKGVFGFLTSKTKYMQTLSSHLYFQNLANNVSVLTRLVDAAEAEEAKELLLAYFLLYVERNRDYTEEELDRRVEEWLLVEFSLNVDFEVADAVRKLQEKRLMVERPAEGPSAAPGPRRVLKVCDLPTALRRLDESWDNYFSAGSEWQAADDRLADADWPPYPAGSN